MKRREFLLGGLACGVSWKAGAQGTYFATVGDVQPGQAWVLGGHLQTGERPRSCTWSTPAKGLSGRLAFPSKGALHLKGLPDATRIAYELHFAQGTASGSFLTPPRQKGSAITFQWGGDVCGQGWGIDPAHGGMATFASMHKCQDAFLLHCGDTVYADGPLPAEKPTPQGIWRNQLTPAKSRVAKTLADFRGNQAYNFLDPHYQNFFAHTSVVAQWDDHEVLDNWDPQHHDPLARDARQAFLEFWPVSTAPKMYRKIAYGPDLELFVLDLRSYRAPNGSNRQSEEGPDTVLLGREQLDWLKKGLRESRASWKFIAGEMPLSTYNVQWGLDSWANGEGPPLGRELELAELLSFLKGEQIERVVWLSADVHYAAAIHYHPERAQFKDFLPFWEFIAGPLHAGTFPPALPLDPTFGAKMVHLAVPPDMPINSPPSAGHQFFGRVHLKGARGHVTMHRRDGSEVFRETL